MDKGLNFRFLFCNSKRHILARNPVLCNPCGWASLPRVSGRIQN